MRKPLEIKFVKALVNDAGYTIADYTIQFQQDTICAEADVQVVSRFGACSASIKFETTGANSAEAAIYQLGDRLEGFAETIRAFEGKSPFPTAFKRFGPNPDPSLEEFMANRKKSGSVDQTTKQEAKSE